MKKHTIWSNINLDIEDWRDDYKEYLEENGFDERHDNDDDLYKWMMGINDEYFNDEQYNLNVSVSGRIIAIADLGFWNGRVMGYELLDHNINDCLQFEEACEYAEFFCDRYDLKSEQHHHDGCYYITYREIKPEITSDQVDNFCWKLCNNKVTQKDITRYTRSLRPYVVKVYGWR